VFCRFHGEDGAAHIASMDDISGFCFCDADDASATCAADGLDIRARMLFGQVCTPPNGVGDVCADRRVAYEPTMNRPFIAQWTIRPDDAIAAP
jgi:hypothetical protein